MVQAAITSTNISSASWENNTLTLTFHNGGVYVYEDVPERVYNELVAAESAGKYFHAYIKRMFAYRKVEEPSVIPA